MGWPLCWNQQLRSANCLCGLLEQLRPDVKFDLIKNENFSGDEPDRTTNHQRPEGE